MKREAGRFALVCLVAAGAASCAGGGTPGAHTLVEVAGVRVRDAWARASPGMASAGAAYMDLEASRPDTLVGAEVADSLAARVEIHEVVAGAGGEMRMQRVDAVALAVGGATRLRPGAFHLMLLELRRPLVAGDTLRMRLRFRAAGVVDVPVPVRAL